MYCVKCGAVVADDQFYCNKCAKEAARQSSEPVAPVSAPADEPVSSPYSTPEPARQAPDSFPAQETGYKGSDAAAIKLNPQLDNNLPALYAKLSAFKKGIFTNGLICIAGVLITVVTYSAASNRGGTYFIWWGAVIYGGAQFIRCLYYYFKIKEMIRKLNQQQIQGS